MAVRRPEFIPFCYVTSAIKFIYSATQPRRVADAGELPEVPGTHRHLLLLLLPPAPLPLPPLPVSACSTGENETANEYWKRVRDGKWCIVDRGNILREKKQNGNVLERWKYYLPTNIEVGGRNVRERAQRKTIYFRFDHSANITL